MVTAEPEVPKGGAVRAQLVGGHRLRREAVFSQQLAHQLDGRAAVSPALKQHVEDLAFMVDRAPEIHPPSGDPDHHLIEVPAIARPWTTLAKASRDHRSEFQYPTADALVGEVEPSLRKQLLDVAIAQGKAQVEPNRMLNHGGRETVPTIGDRKHPRSLRPVGGHAQVILTMPRDALRDIIDTVWGHCERSGTRGRTVTLKVMFASF